MEVEIWIALDNDNHLLSYARFLDVLAETLKAKRSGYDDRLIDSTVKIVRQTVRLPKTIKTLNDLPF